MSLILAKKKLLMAQGGGGPDISKLFATTLWSGNGSPRTVVSGVRGDLEWIKARTGSGTLHHRLYDRVRGVQNSLVSNLTIATSNTGTGGLTAFNSDGFTVGADLNDSGATYVGWSFAKAERFFDIVTYTGNGSNRTIAHNLGVAPGLITVKSRTSGLGWMVYHRSTGAGEYAYLNATDSFSSYTPVWQGVTPTATDFYVGTDGEVNGNTTQYVAYLFAHDIADDGVIQCGSYTGTGAAGNLVTLGWEPQFLLCRSASSANQWNMFDTARGWGATDARLRANAADAEDPGSDFGYPTSTGFYPDSGSDMNQSGQTYIYMAIRKAA